MRILVFLLAWITAPTQCMEQLALINSDDSKEIIETEISSFGNLLDELMVYLFCFILETCLKKICKKLAHLSLVNRKFKQIANKSARPKF